MHWTLDELWSLPVELYEELIAMIVEDQKKDSGAGEGDDEE